MVFFLGLIVWVLVAFLLFEMWFLVDFGGLLVESYGFFMTITGLCKGVLDFFLWLSVIFILEGFS